MSGSSRDQRGNVSGAAGFQRVVILAKASDCMTDRRLAP